MVALNIDFEAMDLLDAAPSDPDAAAKALLLVAKRIRSGAPLSAELANHLAGAIEAAMLKPQSHRGSALLRELHLKVGNRRQARVNRIAVGMGVHALVLDKVSLNAAAAQIGVEFGIDDSTVKRIYKNEYLPAKAAHDAIY